MDDLRYKWEQAKDHVSSVEEIAESAVRSVGLAEEQIKALLQDPVLELEYDVSYEEVVYKAEVLPEVLRRSTLVFLLTLLETELNDLCDTAQKSQNQKVPVTSLAGAGIERASNYIRLVAGINLRQHARWEELLRLKELRNLLVHANGRLAVYQLETALAAYVRTNPLLQLEPLGPDGGGACDHVVSIRKGFLHSALEALSEFADWSHSNLGKA